MSEKDFAREFCALTKKLNPVRIENALFTPGLPDVSFSPGFCELKWLKSYPKRETTPVRIEHYTDDQRKWLLRRATAGGGAWLALKVKSDRYVFNAQQAQDVGNLTHSELKQNCLAHWDRLPTAEEFCNVFIQSARLSFLINWP